MGAAPMLASALALAVAGLVPQLAHAAPDGESADADGNRPIRVIGHPDPEGLLPDTAAPKAVSAIGAAFIEKQAATFNAYQLVNILPGANVASTDPFGLSTSSSLTLRGLGQDAIGVTMEGAPQNDIGYYVAYPAQFADPENIARVELSQGSADIASPVVNAVGGLLALSLDAPHRDFGVLADASLGSFNERRVFVRVDSGNLGQSPLRAFVSYSNNRADNWRGPGVDKRQHIDAKIMGEWGNGNTASLAVSYNDASNSTYRSPSLADWQAQGRGYNLAASYGSGDLNYWNLYRQPFRNLYFAAPVHLALGTGLTLDATSYLQFGYGNSPYGASIGPDGYYPGTYLGTQALDAPLKLSGLENGGTVNVLGNWLGEQTRAGQTLRLTLARGAHTLTAGLWLDYGSDRVVESFTPLNANGDPVDGWGHDGPAVHTADGRLFSLADTKTITVAKAFFLADSIALAPRVTLDLGFKGVDLLHAGRNNLPGTQGRVHFDSFAALPRAALHVQLTDRQQVFANVTTNFRAPDEYTLYDTYDGYGGVASVGTTALKNEYSLAQELGWRWQGRNLSASATAFHYAFRNRLVATMANVNGALVNTTLNGGRQESWGVDGEVDWRPLAGMSLYASGEWLHARIKDNLPADGDFLPTAGKVAVSSPEWQFALGGTYDDTRLFGSLAMKYLGPQFATFMNDERIPGYATLDLSIGVHLAGWLDGKRTDLRVNAINVTDPHVLSGVQAVTPAARDTVGTGGTVITGSAPTYYIGSGRAFMVTLARQF
ncbi:TonB-dependent receptor [Novosphingobium pokkalii]|nr:TonB-dependent receptor [Novosphingobium pokkalii]